MEKQSFLYLKIYLFHFLAIPTSMWDLRSPIRDWTCAPTVEAQSFNRWPLRKAPELFLNTATEDSQCQPDLMCRQRGFFFLIPFVSDRLDMKSLSFPTFSAPGWDAAVYGLPLPPAGRADRLPTPAPPASNAGGITGQGAVCLAVELSLPYFSAYFPPWFLLWMNMF